VHDYLNIDRKLVYEVMTDSLGDFRDLIEDFGRWI